MDCETDRSRFVDRGRIRWFPDRKYSDIEAGRRFCLCCLEDKLFLETLGLWRLLRSQLWLLLSAEAYVQE